MRKSIPAFLAVAFLLYWLNEVGEPLDGPLSFGTITPIIKRIVEPKKLPDPVEVVPQTSLTRQPAEAATLESWLANEAAKVSRVDANPARTMTRLKHKATRLDVQDLKVLKRLALEKSVPQDARFLAVFLLGLAENGGAVALLKEVCFAQIPAVDTDREHADELILRAQSLESLVQRLSPNEARSVLRDLLARTSDPILARQAQYWLSKLS